MTATQCSAGLGQRIPQKIGQTEPCMDVMPHPIVNPKPQTSEQELESWLKYMRGMILASWDKEFHPDLNSYFCSCVFKLSKTGKVTNVRILQSSGSEKTDRSFVEAVHSVNPSYYPKLGLDRDIEVDYSSQQHFQPELKMLQK